jgi:carboxymethylenebutenolidase
MGKGARHTGALALLSAAGGVCLAALTATASPGLIMRLGAFVGAGVAAESPALAAAPTTSPEAPKPPAFRVTATSNITFVRAQERTFRVYRKAPEGEGTWPGVVLLHDGWGLTPALQRSIDALAAQGFIVMALEMNKGKAANDPDRAREFGLLLDVDSVSEEAGALLHHLKYLPEVGDHRVGLVGFGSGAKVALRTAMRTDEISGLVVVYPTETPAADALRRIACPIQAVYGGNDAVVPREKVEAFRTALIEAGRNADVQVYEKAGHAFMNEGDPGHDAGAAADAWSLIAAFLRSHL